MLHTVHRNDYLFRLCWKREKKTEPVVKGLVNKPLGAFFQVPQRWYPISKFGIAAGRFSDVNALYAFGTIENRHGSNGLTHTKQVLKCLHIKHLARLMFVTNIPWAAVFWPARIIRKDEIFIKTYLRASQNMAPLLHCVWLFGVTLKTQTQCAYYAFFPLMIICTLTEAVVLPQKWHQNKWSSNEALWVGIWNLCKSY